MKMSKAESSKINLQLQQSKIIEHINRYLEHIKSVIQQKYGEYSKQQVNTFEALD